MKQKITIIILLMMIIMKIKNMLGIFMAIGINTKKML